MLRTLRRDDITEATKDATVSQVLSILRSKAQERNFSNESLCSFLIASVKLRDIKVLFKLCPDTAKSAYAYSEIEEMEELHPLTFACRYRSEDLILYLAAQFLPHSGKEMGHLAIDVLDNILDQTNGTDVSDDTIKKILHPYSKYLGGKRVVERAFARLAPGRILRFLVDSFPLPPEPANGYSHLVIDTSYADHDEGTRRFGMEHVMILCELLAQLTSLSLGVKKWENQAVLYFLEQLAKNKTIDYIWMAGMQFLADEEMRRSVIQALRNLLNKNSSITHFSGQADCSYAMMTSWVQSFQDLLGRNPVGLRFVFKGRLSPSNLFTYDSSLVKGHRTVHLDLPLRVRDEQSVRFFQVIPGKINNLSRLYLRPGEESVVLTAGEIARLTSVIVDLVVKPNAMLQELHLGPTATAILDMKEIFRALQSNTSLTSLYMDTGYGLSIEACLTQCCEPSMAECLTMLQEHNQTLQECWPWERNEKVEYLLDLHYRWRPFATTTNRRRGGAFLNCLEKVWSASDRVFNSRLGSRYVYPDVTVKRRLSVAYGLLRNGPDLWVPSLRTTAVRRRPPKRKTSCFSRPFSNGA